MAVRGDQLQEGFVLGGYRIDELISRGGMGVVYRAKNIALNRIYALKVLAPELAADEQFRERFKRETRIAASLHHANIVGIHYAGEHEDLLFFAMDYVIGTDLREVLLKQGALEPTRAVDLLEQFASAIDAAHRRGLVHRDVKPGNILITVKDGEEHAYLTDFGLAKKFDNASALTAKGLIVGTVDYMAPEQITGNRTDARTDVYALGCVFYQMLTGKVPYERENSVAALFAHVHEPPPPLAEGVIDTYPAFVPVLEKAMAKEPDERYLSAGDFARDAAAALSGMRYTAPATVVGTGEATPIVAPGEATALADPPETTPPVEPSGPIQAARSSELTPLPGIIAPPAETGSEVIDPEPLVASETKIREPPPAREQLPAVAAEATSVPGAETHMASPGPPATVPPAGPPATPSAARPRTTSTPSGEPPAPDVPSRSGDDGSRDRNGAGSRRSPYLLPGLGALVLIAAAVVAVIALSSGSSKPPQPLVAAAALPVPWNHVTGGGTATVVLNGDQVTATVRVHGLINQPHALHIHAGGLGLCPPVWANHMYHGHRFISTKDGIHFYGDPRVALTNSGDTSPNSNVALPRYVATGNFDYHRTVTVPPGVAAAIRAGKAVIVVHGINYHGTGFYDNFLGPSDLDPKLPAEATAPALCGTLAVTKTAAAGRPGATAYAVVLRPPVVRSAAQALAFALLCHLPRATWSDGPATSATEPRATAATVT